MTVYTIRTKIAELVFKFRNFVNPSYSDFERHINKLCFFKHEMSNKFHWEKYDKKKNQYFKKWGFNISNLDSEYYSLVSGIKSDRYVNRTLATHYIYPYLCSYELVSSYMDKNIQKKILGLNEYNSDLQVSGTRDIVYCSNRVFFNSRNQEISEDMALEILTSYSLPMILKPTLETWGGQGVKKIEPSTCKDEFKKLFKLYEFDFTFQEFVKQHPILEAFNPTSLNTIRIVTYRKPNRTRKILYSCLRFGGEGSIIDNVCSGGGYTGIDVDTGKLRDRKKYSYHVMEMPMLQENMPNEIPCWEIIKKAALALHGRLPHFDIVGWDFSVTPEGRLTLIEYNLRPGVGLQQAVGPMFSDEDLEELMNHVSKNKSCFKIVGQVKFEDKPRRASHITHFGFQNIK